MIRIPRPLLKQVVDAAEAAYPAECCGLLAGRDAGAGTIAVTRVVPSPNLAPPAGGGDGPPIDRFEVDPQVRFDLMQALDGTGERIVGHYHSHPDHPAQPSETDLAMAFEPDLAWLIVAVAGGQAIHVTAHAVDAERRQFHPLPLVTDDWRPYPVRPDSAKDSTA